MTRFPFKFIRVFKGVVECIPVSPSFAPSERNALGNGHLVIDSNVLTPGY